MGKIQKFGKTEDQFEVFEVSLGLPSGLSASIITFGAVVRDLKVPLPNGALRRVVLGFPDLGGYLADTAFLGAIVGRVANRIAHGRFQLDGVSYHVACNEGGRHHLHGGFRGFSRRVWSVADHSPSSVTLTRISPAGEEGYPGALSVRCTYRLLEPATLSVRLEARTDAPTLVNLAHHSYFTLAERQPSAAHRLRVNASRHTPCDHELIPTGAVAPVAGTRYDFREFTRISDRTGDTPPLDMNFVIDRDNDALTCAASVEGPDGMLRLDVHTTEPGIQVYDGSHLRPSHPGLDGRPLLPKAGLCLEPQIFPDAINRPAFPSPILRPGSVYRQETEYRFSTVAA